MLREISHFEAMPKTVMGLSCNNESIFLVGLSVRSLINVSSVDSSYV